MLICLVKIWTPFRGNKAMTEECEVYLCCLFITNEGGGDVVGGNLVEWNHIAYFRVHSRANSVYLSWNRKRNGNVIRIKTSDRRYFINKSIYQSVHTLTLSVLNILAISGTSGSSGFGSHRREQMDNNTENKKEKN